MKKWVFFIIILAVMGISGFLYVRTTPQYSLYLLANAIKDNNPDRAFQYFDVDSIADNLVQDLLQQIKKNESSTDPSDHTAQSVAKGLIATMVPMMKEQIKSSLRNSIASHSRDDNMNLATNLGSGFYSV